MRSSWIKVRGFYLSDPDLYEEIIPSSPFLDAVFYCLLFVGFFQAKRERRFSFLIGELLVLAILFEIFKDLSRKCPVILGLFVSFLYHKCLQ